MSTAYLKPVLIDPNALPFKTTFAAQIRAIEPSDDTVREAKASLTELKSLLPADIDPTDDPQILYVAANLYVAGMVNRNDDGVDIETSLAAYRGFEKQQLNIEHDRGRVAGYILKAGLTEFGTDRVITDDEARAAGRPFNVAIVAVLWKVNNPALCSYLSEASSPLHPDYKTLSLSFEVGFTSYNIAVIDAETRVISEASKIYAPSDADFDAMSKRLRSFGGSGRAGTDDKDGLYQILSGTFIPLGGGIVAAPAAAVKGIVAITECQPEVDDEDNEDDDIEDDDKDDNKIEAAVSMPVIPQPVEVPLVDLTALRADIEILLKAFEKKADSRIKSTETRVSPITSNTITVSNMNKLDQLKQKVASIEKPEDMKEALAGAVEIAEAIMSESVRIQTELDAEKTHGIQIEAARAEAAAANDTLKKTVDELKAELDGIRATQLAAEAAAKFDERMATIDEEFELDDEDRALLIDDVKALDDAGFDAYMVKAKKIMKEKTKLFKKKEKEDKTKKFDDLKAALAAKGVPFTVDEDGLFKEIIASAQANSISDPISNTIETSTKTLAEKFKEEFEENTVIGGKKLSEYKK